MATGKFLCCSSTQLPVGVDLICGNDICRDVENDDLTTCVVTRSMSAAADHSATADRIQIPNTDHVEDVNDLDDLNLQSLFLDPTPIVSFDAINLKQLITLQHADPSLKHYFNLTTEPDTEGTCFLFLTGW